MNQINSGANEKFPTKWTNRIKMLISKGMDKIVTIYPFV